MFRELKYISLIKFVDFFALIGVICYFLFPQYVFAMSFNKDKEKVLNFSILSSAVIDKYQNKTFISIQKADYFLKLKQQESSLREKAEKEKISIIVENKPINQEVKPLKPNKILLAKNSVKIKKAAEPDLVEDIESMNVIITAFSSTPDQTDSSPFITASGTNVRDGIIAANFLPFGAKVKFPALFGDKEFVVEDRMKSNTKVDIWFPDRQSAKNFGVKRSKMVIVFRPGK